MYQEITNKNVVCTHLHYLHKNRGMIIDYENNF